MTLIQIFELDSNENPVSTLQTGEHIFGRGPLLKCTDRRVSRNHGVIKVTDGAATITATHLNPCFYQAANSSTITILPKGNPVDLNDGDKFALLADQFWFRIKIEKNGSSEFNRPNGSSSLQAVELSSNYEENGRVSPLSFTSAPVSSKSGDVSIHNDSDFLQATQQAAQEANKSSAGIQESNKNLNEEADNVNADDSSDSMDFLQTTQKRGHEADAETPDTKKVKLDNKTDTKSNEENELLSVLGDLKAKEVMSGSEDEDNDKAKSEGQNKKELMSEPEDENNDKNAASGFKGGDNKEAMSDSEDDNITVKVKPNTPKKNPYKWKKDESAASTQSARDAELKSMLFSSDEDNETKTDNPKPNSEAKVSSSSRNVDADKDVNLKNDGDDSKVRKGNNKRKKKDSDDDDDDEKKNKNDKEDQDPNVASTSGSNEKRQWRDHCWYGLECYRKSASHLAEYSHPGDSDFGSDPEDDRPMCAFGAACYRRNKDHRRDYKHPNKPQKPTGPGKRTKKKKDKAATPKKRTTKKKYNQSSEEDDYDMQDPFIDDSGSEYEATSSGDDDSDSDWSGASEDETKRLVKEAKRFMKGKKKDKNDDVDD